MLELSLILIQIICLIAIAVILGHIWIPYYLGKNKINKIKYIKMKKEYKLICKYPGSPKLDTIVIKNDEEYYNTKDSALEEDIEPSEVEDYPEYWEELNEKPIIKKLTIEDIDGYKTACKILNVKEEFEASNITQLKTIAKAANFIENGYKPHKFNWNDNSSKYYPYFRNEAGGGVVFHVSYGDCSNSHGQVAYFINKKTSDYIGRKFIHLYLAIRNDN